MAIEELVKSEFQEWLRGVIVEHLNIKPDGIVSDIKKIRHSLNIIHNMDTKVLPVQKGKFKEEGKITYWINIPIAVTLEGGDGEGENFSQNPS